MRVKRVTKTKLSRPLKTDRWTAHDKREN